MAPRTPRRSRPNRDARPAAGDRRNTAPPPAAWTTTRLLLASLLVLVTVAAYANCFSLPFVLDDDDAIVHNPTIRSLSPIAQTLSGPYQSSTAGRPLVNLSLALNYAAGGLDPRGYRVVNLTVHVLCGLLLFGIVRRTLAKPSAGPVDADTAWIVAFFAALVWLVHPLATETIDYVTQRTESLMALAYVSTLYAFVRASDSDRPAKWSGASIVSCWLGMLCKESMVTAPVMVFLYDVVFCAGAAGAAIRRRPVFYAGLAASGIVVAALVASNGRSHSAGFASGVSPWTYFLNQPSIVLRYFRLALWPTSLIFDYGLPRAMSVAAALPAALPLAALLLGTAALWFFERRLAFLGTWVFVTLAPTSTIVPIATEVGAERRMYLPMMALAVLAIVGLHVALRRRAVFVGALVAASAALAVLTFARNAEYRDPDGLLRQVIERYPHGRAHYNLGVSLRDKGRREEAIQEFRLALPDTADAEYALGFEAMKDGRFDEAIARLRRYLELKPLDINAIRASNVLGVSLLSAKRPEEAIAAFRDTLRMHPGDVDGTGGLGQALLDAGHFDDALTVLGQYAHMLPESPSAHFNLGLTLMKLNRFEEAASELTRAASLNPNDPAGHANLGTTLVQLGRIDAAIEQFRQASAHEKDPAAREEIRGIVAELEAQKKGAGHR